MKFWLLVLAAPALLAQQAEDQVLRAMRDEVARAAELKFPTLESPYFVELTLDDGRSVSAAATLGALVRSGENRFRIPNVRIRVGSYQFDDTNYVGSGMQFARGYDFSRFPLDDSYAVLRRMFWLAIDTEYKSSVQTIARKRAALKSVTVTENLPDFGRVEPVKLLEAVRLEGVDRTAWEAKVRQWSAIFTGFPALSSSNVDFEEIRNVRYQVNSEGTQIRRFEHLAIVKVRARAQASDGMPVWSARTFVAMRGTVLMDDPAIPRAISQMAELLTEMTKAPVAESYSGPVLFEGEASPQLFAQALGKNLALFRRPVSEPGRQGGFPSSDLEGKQGSRILPEWMDVVDDPTQVDWRGRTLMGHYKVDQEGVLAGPVSLVEKGVLKNFLLTRQPMRGFSQSNGRARLPGSFGAYGAAFSNLFVQARETMPAAGLKTKLLEMIKARGKPYGLVVRKLDYPSASTFDELRRLLTAAGRGSAPPVSPPVAVYRVYPDGREELVRGLRFRGLGVRSLRDIQAASDDMHAFDLLDNGIPLAMMGMGSLVAETTIVAPSVLIDDVDLDRVDEEFPKPPIVPPPS
ncbi:MAG: metallopeptidase TldD-related protein [Bryobacteraceae bacterium]